MTVARRALIVQRVIVDGWTAAETATRFGISQRQVDGWVAEFRRSGMASLRRASASTLARRMVLRPVRAAASAIGRALRPLLMRKHPPQPLLLHRLGDELRSRD